MNLGTQAVMETCGHSSGMSVALIAGMNRKMSALLAFHFTTCEKFSMFNFMPQFTDSQYLLHIGY